MSLLVAFALGIAAPAAPSGPLAPAATQHISPAPDADAKKYLDAVQLIHDGKPAEAIALLEQVSASFESRYTKTSKQIYCARTDQEALLYAGMGAAAKRDTEVLDETWCGSYFLKGFALIDLDRPDEAKPWFDKAIAMAPMDSQFLAERAEWYKVRRDWPHAYSEFETAATAADISPEDFKTSNKARAWRGMAYVRIEQGKLNEAEALLRKCLELNPDDSKAKSQLDYIASIRPHAS